MKQKKKMVDLDLARRIRAAKRPIYIAEDDAPPPDLPSDGLLVRQWAGVNESRVIDCVGTAFVIYLTITVNLPTFAISSFGLELPWEQTSFYWLEDPLVTDGKCNFYHFGDTRLPQVGRNGALNHCADVRQTYSPGHSLKGCLLGYGFDSIPDEYRHGAMIPAFVIVYDQFGRQYRRSVELRVDRLAAPRRVLKKRNLWEHRDLVPKKGA